MPTFRGKPACSCLVEWLPVFEAELKRRKVIKHSLDIFQLIGGAKASAGTHRPGGAFDIGQTGDTVELVAREMGAAFWTRTPPKFSLHGHGVLNGCPHNAGGRYQIAALAGNYNGLGYAGRGGRDDGKGPDKLRTFRQGIVWAKAQTAPKPVAKKSLDLTAATQNVIARRLSVSKPSNIDNWKRGAAYETRVPRMVGMLAGRGVDVIATCEAGDKALSNYYTDACTDLLAGEFTDWLDGDYWDISQTVTYRHDLFAVVARGEFQLSPVGPGSSHDMVPWVHLRHPGTGIEHVPLSVHFISGQTAANKRDRGLQAVSLITQAEKKFGKDLPLLILGDFNAPLSADDPVTKAFNRAGYIDAEQSPYKAINAEYDTSNGLKSPPKKNRSQIDRAFAKPKHIAFTLREIVVNLDAKGNHKTPWPSDHQPLIVDYTVHGK